MSYGEPDDVPGQCNAHLYVADNFGDNHATLRCQLPKGHPANHVESFSGRAVVVQWEKDERLYPHKADLDGDDYCKICNREASDGIHAASMPPKEK